MNRTSGYYPLGVDTFVCPWDDVDEAEELECPFCDQAIDPSDLIVTLSEPLGTIAVTESTYHIECAAEACCEAAGLEDRPVELVMDWFWGNTRSYRG